MKFVYNQGPISIFKHPRKGFCVVAEKNISKDKLLCTSVVSEIGFKDLKKKSSFNDYPMYWNKKTDCIAFGPINLLNHSNNSNAYLVRDYKSNLIKMYAKRTVKKGEEMTINYDCKLWFKVVE